MEIDKILLDCGINPKRKGYFYLREAIAHRMVDGDIKLVHGIFVRVGMRHSTNYKAVERACRTALQCAADDYGTLAAAARLGQAPRSNCYTCGDFIALAALRCKQERGYPRAV